MGACFDMDNHCTSIVLQTSVQVLKNPGFLGFKTGWAGGPHDSKNKIRPQMDFKFDGKYG